MKILGSVPEHSTLVEIDNQEVIENLYCEMSISEIFEMWPDEKEKDKLRRELNGK